MNYLEEMDKIPKNTQSPSTESGRYRKYEPNTNSETDLKNSQYTNAFTGKVSQIFKDEFTPILPKLLQKTEEKGALIFFFF